MKGNIIEVTDFSQKTWKALINESVNFKENINRKRGALKNKCIGLLFDSASLRTRLSFEVASYHLGADTYFINIESVTHENGMKRETIEDIIDTMDRMVDCYVVRDYSRKVFDVLKRKENPPFINGFCITGHPSQALADLSVIKWKSGTDRDLNYSGVCPDSGSGVMESFIYGVLLLGGNITIITPTGKLTGKNKNFKDRVSELSEKYGGSLNTTNNIQKTIAETDVLYVDEWWDNTKDFLKKKIGKYCVDKTFLNGYRDTISIMHALPAHPGREIAAEIMRCPQSIIFDQAEFRIYSAMSLLTYLLGK